jgi:hypothetical protein
MKKINILLPVLCLAALHGSPTFAQDIPGSAVGPTFSLSVFANQPVLTACSNSPSCFRVFLKIVGDPGSRTGVAFAGSFTAFGTDMTDTIAMAPNGAVCHGYALGGLPKAFPDMAGNPSFLNLTPYIVTSDNAANLVVQFNCDEPINRGTPVNMQVTLAVLPGGVLPPGYGIGGAPRQAPPGHIAKWSFNSIVVN